MSPEQTVWCSACKASMATTFIQGTLEIIGHEKYQIKCLNLALCDACLALAEVVTNSGQHLAEALAGGAR
jgi:hypothetical protein